MPCVSGILRIVNSSGFSDINVRIVEISSGNFQLTYRNVLNYERCLNFVYAMHKCFAFANIDIYDNRLSGAHQYRDIQRCEERIGMYRKMEGDTLRMDEKTQRKESGGTLDALHRHSKK